MKVKKFIKDELAYRRMKKNIKNHKLEFDFDPLAAGVVEAYAAMISK